MDYIVYNVFIEVFVAETFNGETEISQVSLKISSFVFKRFRTT